MLRNDKLRIGTILLANNNSLPIQKVLISLTTVRIIWIREVSLDVGTVSHLDVLGLVELDIMLLLLQSRLIFHHILWRLLLLL